MANHGGGRVRVPPGMVHSVLSATVDDAVARRICRVQIGPSPSLPGYIQQGPERLEYRQYPENDSFQRASQQLQRDAISFRPMDDSSAASCENWNKQVAHARAMGLLWVIELPLRTMDGADRWHVLVRPTDRKATRTTNVGGAEMTMSVFEVDAWLPAPRVFDELRVVQDPPGGNVRRRTEQALEREVMQQVDQNTGNITYRGIHSVAQMHEDWVFGALAELLDNAVDARASFVDVRLEHAQSSRTAVLSILDDGEGMDRATLNHMLCKVGWSSRMNADGEAFIGKYGMGFKTGFARLGAAVTVLTKFSANVPHVDFDGATIDGAMSSSSSTFTFESRMTDAAHNSSASRAQDVWSIGLLAFPGEGSNPSPFDKTPEWNQSIRAHVLKYRPDLGQLEITCANDHETWNQIRDRSPLKTLSDVIAQFARIPGNHGTLILVTRLREYGPSQLELQVLRGDIVIPHLRNAPRQHREWAGSRITMDSSLSAYAAVLYRRPRLRISVQDEVVTTRTIEATLRTLRAAGSYQRGAYKMFIGRSDHADAMAIKGAMMYHDNRLIASYLFPEEFEVGFISVLDTASIPGIVVLNNKQHYNANEAFNRMQAWIRSSCRRFKNATRDRLEMEDVLDDWVQCEDCKKWRKCPAPEARIVKAIRRWTCNLNTWDARFAHCDAPEEPWGARSSTIHDNDQNDADRDADVDHEETREAQLTEVVGLNQEPRQWYVFEGQVRGSDPVGSGRFADVYRVIDDANVTLALKRFRITEGADDARDTRDAFTVEMTSQRAVQHPNIVSVHGWIDEPLCLLTEFVDGRDLHRLIHGARSVPPTVLTHKQKHGIFLGIAEGLVAMHREHIVHRDLKPTNVMIEWLPSSSAAQATDFDAVYRPRLCDFGLARKVRDANITRTTSAGGSRAGTPLYSAPERLHSDDDDEDDGDEEVDGHNVAYASVERSRSAIYKAADVWSFGVIMLELLLCRQPQVVQRTAASEPPFEFGVDLSSQSEKTYKIIDTKEPKAIRMLAKGHPFYCDPNDAAVKPYLFILRPCLSRDPAVRPMMAEVLKQLREPEIMRQIDPRPPELLYRVLSSGIMRPVSLVQGLLAKRQHSKYTPQEHVSNAGIESHFISTTKSLQWAMWYWLKVMVEQKLTYEAAPFVVELVLDDPRVVTHDLSTLSIANNFRLRFAHSAEEVLAERYIPGSCIKNVYDAGRSERARQLMDFTRNHCITLTGDGEPTIRPYAAWLTCVHEKAGFKRLIADGTFWRELRQQAMLRHAEWNGQRDSLEPSNVEHAVSYARSSSSSSSSSLSSSSSSSSSSDSLSSSSYSSSSSSSTTSARPAKRKDAPADAPAPSAEVDHDDDSDADATESDSQDAYESGPEDTEVVTFRQKRSLFQRVKQRYFHEQRRSGKITIRFHSPQFNDSARSFFAELPNDEAREEYASAPYKKTRTRQFAKQLKKSSPEGQDE